MTQYNIRRIERLESGLEHACRIVQQLDSICQRLRSECEAIKDELMVSINHESDHLLRRKTD